MPLEPQRVNIPISGGLSQDETPEYLDPPALYQVDNFYHRTKSSLTKRSGYDLVYPVVDSRNTTVDLSIPLSGTNSPIDRFITTENTCTFAARGYLWTYDPLFFSGATGITPKPNTIRHCEIPDLQIQRDTVVALTDARTDTGKILDAASATGSSGAQCLNFLTLIDNTTSWHLRITDANGVVVSEYVPLSSTDTLLHPCVAAYSGGFVCTILNFQDAIIQAYKFSYQTMAWTVFSWPRIDWGGEVRHEFNYYDLCGSNSNVITVGHCIADCVWVPPGSQDAAHDRGVIIEYTIDAVSEALTHGPFHVGKTGWAGTQDPWPVFAVAGTSQAKYACVWNDGTTDQVKFKSFDGDTVKSTIVVHDPGGAVKVGLGVIAPTTGFDALWNVVHQIEAPSLLTSNLFKRYTVTSGIISSTQSFIGYPRVYFSSKIASNPFGINGGSYVLLVPDELWSTPAQNYDWADVPWILTRTWCDQWRGDPGEYNTFNQRPMGVWGYGTTLTNIQPSRITPDLTSSNRKAFGALVTSDVFRPGYGNSVVNVTFDPTSPDRYDSAPLPGGGAVFGCAQPWVFDGSLAFEAAFVHRPVVVSQAQSDGGNLAQDVNSDDWHYFKLIFEHSDERGRVTRSPVSETYLIKVTATLNKVTLRVANLFWNARKANSIKVKVYMCRDNVSFALVASGVCLSYDNTDTPDDVYVDVLDYAARNSPFIYTQTGELESGYPQLASHLVRWNNRIWLADGHDISHSHAFVVGDQVSFPDSLIESLDTEISALCPLDDRLVLFSQDSVLMRTGEGPSPNGDSSSYSNWSYLNHEVGTLNPRSVFKTPMGVFFQSRRGLELMDGSGAVMHQRAAENYFSNNGRAGDTVVGTLSIPGEHQARILYKEAATNTLKQLVFDYTTGTWSRWYGSSPVQWVADSYCYVGDITSVAGQVYLADRNGQLFVEASGRFYDQLVPVLDPTQRHHIDWAIKTPWIKSEGLQGFQRVWRSTLSFKTLSSTPAPYIGLDTSVSIDYSDQVEVHPTRTLADLAPLRNPTSGIVYMTIGHKYQQCRAYQIQLSSTDSTVWTYMDNVSGVYELLGIWSEFGIEPGTGRGRREGKL